MKDEDFALAFDWKCKQYTIQENSIKPHDITELMYTGLHLVQPIPSFIKVGCLIDVKIELDALFFGVSEVKTYENIPVAYLGADDCTFMTSMITIPIEINGAGKGFIVLSKEQDIKIAEAMKEYMGKLKLEEIYITMIVMYRDKIHYVTNIFQNGKIQISPKGKDEYLIKHYTELSKYKPEPK